MLLRRPLRRTSLETGRRRVAKRLLSMGMVFGRISEETPAFELLKEHDSYQIRQYVPSVSAETTYVADGLDENTSQAFRRLAQYIGVFSTPQNKNAGGQAEPVAMTAPVLMAPPGAQGMTRSPASSAVQDESVTARLTQAARSGPRTMAFLLPAKYVAASPPSKLPCVTAQSSVLPYFLVALRHCKVFCPATGNQRARTLGTAPWRMHLCQLTALSSCDSCPAASKP